MSSSKLLTHSYCLYHLRRSQIALSPIWIIERQHSFLVSTWTLRHWLQIFESSLPTRFLSIQQSFCQTHLSSAADRMWMGPFQKPYRSLGRLHQFLFLCSLMQLLHCRWSPDQSGMICPLWSMLAVYNHLTIFHMFRHVFQDDCSITLLGTVWSVVPRAVPFSLLKNWRDVSLFPIPKDFAWVQLLFKYDREQLSNLCSSSLVILGCIWSWGAFLAYFSASTFTELRTLEDMFLPIPFSIRLPFCLVCFSVSWICAYYLPQ